MKKLSRNVAKALIPLALLLGGSAFAQGYVNITAGGVFAPGVFGQISIGSNPPPPVYNPQPIYVERVDPRAPIVYMHVPDHERRDWRRYCGNYHACDRRVQFVQVDERDRWWEGHDHGRHNGDERRNDHGDHGDGRDNRDRRDHRDNRDNGEWPRRDGEDYQRR